MPSARRTIDAWLARWAPALAACAAFVATFLAAALADARPGGGHSYSGGSSSSGGGYSSGGGSSGGGDIGALIWLIFRYPQLGVPVAIIVVIVVIVKAKSPREGALDVGEFHEAPPIRHTPPVDLRARLAADDPGFSEVLFVDFAYALYARAQRARHDATALAELAAYVGDGARAQLAARAQRGVVSAVVVGSLRVESVRQSGDRHRVQVAFEANQTGTGPNGRAASFYVTEAWTFERKVGVTTKPWKGERTFDCPNCAAPATQIQEHRCGHCGELVDGGRFDWQVVASEERVVSPRGPSLTGTVEEVGTLGPTLFDPTVQTDWGAIVAEDPGVSIPTLGMRVGRMYDEINRGWNAERGGEQIIRPWVSDGMMGYMAYWLDAYRQQGLKNQLVNAKIDNWTIVKVRRDAHYDAVTIRLWATGQDFTVDAQGKVVGGSRRASRDYSEYWTLVRGAGVRGQPRADRGCPSCGAELKAGMGGTCEYCGAHVTRGEFDWVLSRIEQDESYRG